MTRRTLQRQQLSSALTRIRSEEDLARNQERLLISEKMAALGYIGSAVKTKPVATNTLVDPKDRLAVHEAIQEAGDLNNNAEYAKSAELLEKILRDDPANPQVRLLLLRRAICVHSTGRHGTKRARAWKPPHRWSIVL